jgi:hypothetical protein
MTSKGKERLMRGSFEEMEQAAAAGFVLPVHWDLAALMSVVGALQLALRHPGFKDRPTARTVRGVVDLLIARTAEEGFEACADVMRLGDDPGEDVHEG